MPSEPDPYARLAAPFVEHYQTLRGRLRFALVSEQLDHHLGNRPVRILDIGGGAGHQALRLARQGHQVTLLDPSAQMLDRAAEALDRAPGEVRDRVELLHGSTDAAAGLVDRRRFGLVCCHMVLPYVDDPGPVLATLVELTGPGGLISVLFKNRDALAMRAALEERWNDALDAFDADADVGGLGVPTRAHTLVDVQRLLTAAGASVEAWYGIRVFTDHLVGQDVPADEFDGILAVEREASTRDPYRRVARLLHVVARREAS